MGRVTQPVSIWDERQAAPRALSSQAWKSKAFEVLLKRAEFFLVVGVLVVVAAVFHWIPYKLSFLNFFYLPVLAAGYLLGSRRAVLISLMCVLLVFTYYLWAWTKHALTASVNLLTLFSIVSGQWETLLSLAMWGGFLILTAFVFAHIHERMTSSYLRVRELNEMLQKQSSDLRELNRALKGSTSELQQRAEESEQKNLVIEKLKQQVEQTLYSTMDSTVARLMIQGRLRQEKRYLSVLFCDLKNFTGYSEERRPEVILEDLNEFYQAMEELIDSYHGHIDKYMGDGIMCEFGAPIEYEQHGLQAVIAGLKMQEAFAKLLERRHRGQKVDLALRVGIASGDAVVGLLGSRRRSYSALGEAVNLAQRLEQLCEPGSVYVSERTYDAVQNFVEAEQVRDLAGRRADDQQYRDMIAQKERQLERERDSPELLLTIGMLYLHVRDASKALVYLRRAMEIKPDDRDIKVAYADASVKRDECEKISIRGMANRQAVFKVAGLVDPLRGPGRFPKNLHDRYGHVEKLIEIPENITLPTEVVDGSVGHSLAVTFISYALADHMGVPEEIKRDLLIAARLQDIGKSVVWHHVLNRRGGLSDRERKEVEGHVAEGVTIAKRMGYDQPGVIEIIANHHEALNGTGFPRAVKGDQIPLGARISGVADMYCALTEWRPFRPAWDSRVALNEVLKRAAAGQYDPKVVDALAELVTDPD